MLSHWGYPRQDDGPAVAAMVRAQWRSIWKRVGSTYAEAYRDRPGASSVAQRRAGWIASLPVFSDAASVCEAGCGCGRNLAELARRRHVRVEGLDICPEAIGECRRILPSGLFTEADLLELAPESTPRADVVLACGVLTHIPPDRVRGVLDTLWSLAERALVIVDELGHGVLKGPRRWRPLVKATGEYVAWAHDLWTPLNEMRTHAVSLEAVPEHLRTIGAQWLYVVRK